MPEGGDGAAISPVEKRGDEKWEMKGVEGGRGSPGARRRLGLGGEGTCAGGAPRGGTWVDKSCSNIRVSKCGWFRTGFLPSISFTVSFLAVFSTRPGCLFFASWECCGNMNKPVVVWISAKYGDEIVC